MTTKPQVLVAGIDFSLQGSKALSGALELASQRETSALHVVHVASPYEDGVRLKVPPGTENAERVDGRLIPAQEAATFTQDWVDEWLRAFAHQHGDKLPCPVKIHLAVGDPADEIRRIAIDTGADVICVASHGRKGLRRVLLGSIAEAIVRDAPCNVIVVRDKEVPDIEPAYTPEEQKLHDAAQEHHLGSRHTYHYYDRNTMANHTKPGSIVGST